MGEGKGSLVSASKQQSVRSSLTQQQSIRSSLVQQLSTHSSLTQQQSLHSLTQQLSNTSTDEGWILKHINGYATSGQMTAILGARFGRKKGLSRSGAGKTTLLSILCGRNTGYTGTFRINGREVNDASLR